MTNLWETKYLSSCLSDKHHWNKLNRTSKHLIDNQQYEHNDERLFTHEGCAMNSTSSNIEKIRCIQTLKQEHKNTLLRNCREYLAKYQEIYGTPRTEYPFTSLVKAMGQATGQSLLALFHIFINVAPIAEVFLCILRFLLDKAITIQNSDNYHQSIIKYVIFGVQLVSIYACLMFMFGFILLPILDMLLDIIAKILLYN